MMEIECSGIVEITFRYDAFADKSRRKSRNGAKRDAGGHTCGRT